MESRLANMADGVRRILRVIEEFLHYMPSGKLLIGSKRILRSGIDPYDIDFAFHWLEKEGLISNYKRAEAPPEEIYFDIYPDREHKITPGEMETDYYHEFDVDLNKIGPYLKGKHDIAKRELTAIFYDPKTGDGWAKKKSFKFTKGKRPFFLFGKLYESIGEPISRDAVWGVIGHKGNSLYTNTFVKKLRKQTGLGVHEMVLSNGDVTLIGSKLYSHPK